MCCKSINESLILIEQKMNKRRTKNELKVERIGWKQSFSCLIVRSLVKKSFVLFGRKKEKQNRKLSYKIRDYKYSIW